MQPDHLSYIRVSSYSCIRCQALYLLLAHAMILYYADLTMCVINIIPLSLYIFLILSFEFESDRFATKNCHHNHMTHMKEA